VVPIPPLSFNFRDLNFDASARSGVIDGGRFLDGSNWTVSTGGGTAQATNTALDNVPPAGLVAGPAGVNVRPTIDPTIVGLVVGLVVVALILQRGR
jgi:hypothetical protein